MRLEGKGYAWAGLMPLTPSMDPGACAGAMIFLWGSVVV